MLRAVCLSSSTTGVLVALFFFQAEDGIRDFHVTGVQTCALPIYFHILRLVETTQPQTFAVKLRRSASTIFPTHLLSSLPLLKPSRAERQRHLEIYQDRKSIV